MLNDDDIKNVYKKIDNLNSVADEMRVNDSTKAMTLSREAVELATEIHYEKGLARGLATLGFSYIRISQHEEAQNCLDKSYELFTSLNDKHGQCDILEYYGIIQRSLGNLEASLSYLFKALALAEEINYKKTESQCLYHVGASYRYLGKYDEALNYFLKSLDKARLINYSMVEGYCLNNIGLIYLETGDYTNALEYYNQGLAIRRKLGDKWGESGSLDNIGFIYFKIGNYPEAITYCTQSLTIAEEIVDQKGQGNALLHLGNIYEKLGNNEQAVDCYNRSLQIRRKIGDKKGEAEILLSLAELSIIDNFKIQSDLQILELLNNALELGQQTKALGLLAKIKYVLYEAYKKSGNYNEALSNLESSMSIEKEIHNASIKEKVLNLEISNRVEQSKKEAEIFRLRNIELVVLNEEITKQKEEIFEQKKKTEEAFVELKSAQKQLIQSEKMASLGELTTGIAHEIQNPLNFVNNFSDVSTELVDEMNLEIDKGNLEDAKLIAKDLKLNLEKINHHGKRAGDIVKGMLQHSRSSSGVKEPADINKLVNEYLRLAYHGLRAKDKSFNAGFKTDFDKSIGRINIVPQDIGRVILNLINNAFYAVGERAKAPHPPEGGAEYKPMVTVSTKKLNDKILIVVIDNGNGIPQNIVDKIFQPFFTTKPTGEGTGLGLSLSYDIIKAHGGEIKVNTKEGEGSEFVIQLPSG